MNQVETDTLLKTIYYRSPVGNLRITGGGKGISSVHFTDTFKALEQAEPLLLECVTQLDEYFTGMRKSFSLKFDLQGTDFQKKVWTELLKIPYGKTISYQELARRLGDGKVIRAAASANGANPVAIIIPCHRVIGSNGDLVGYAGGLHRKKWLLGFENGLKQTSLF